MKKNLPIFTVALFLILTTTVSAQKTIIVNGGQFGNPQEDVTVLIYDPSTANSHVIDTIHSQSVQEILVDSIYAFVAAQDSIVKYNLNTESRVAAAKFNGFSTKSLAIYSNYLLVGNWYGKTSSNLYLYNRNTLALEDSITGITKGVNSLLIIDSIALISQNNTTSNFEDTLGYVARINLNNLQQLSNLTFNSYWGDIGQLIPKGNGFVAVNPNSNTFLEFLNSNDTLPTAHNFPFDVQVSSSSQYSLREDTLFAKFGNRIGTVDFNSFQLLDSSIVDTVITAFAYDTVRNQFYVTQTDFFSYNTGGVYSRSGSKLSHLPVGYSPEVIVMFYDPTITSAREIEEAPSIARLFPNPAHNHVTLELTESLSNAVLKIFDMRGKLLLKKEINELSKRINTSHLQAGAYIVLLESDSLISTSRLIKQ